MNAQWLHYVGGYYTPKKFLREARRIGISRRASSNIVKNMNFGDRVLLLNWREGRPAAFGEFRISRIFFDADLQAQVVEKLKAEDKIVEDHSGGASTKVTRECGSYMMGGGASVSDDTTSRDIIETAEKIREEEGKQGEALWVMIGGELTGTIVPPQTVVLADGAFPPFTRSFMHMPEGLTFKDEGEAPAITPAVVGVRGYGKRTRKQREGE